MISFNQYLSESRSAPLYHATGASNLGEIFNQRGFEPRTTQLARKLLLAKGEEGEKLALGVSLTRSLRFAFSWAPIVFEFDQQKLAHNYRIIPLQYWQEEPLFKDKKYPARKLDSTGTRNEYEEFVVTNKNLPLTYVKRIIVKTDMMHSFVHQKMGDSRLKFPVEIYPKGIKF